MILIEGIISGIVQDVTGPLQIVRPYYWSPSNIGNNTNIPLITVTATRTGSNFDTVLPNLPYGNIQLLAVAVPAGHVGPTGPLMLISGYAYTNGTEFPGMAQITTDPVINSGNISSIYNPSDPKIGYDQSKGISGNAYYDIYATHILTGISGYATVVAGYCNMVVMSGVLTRSPYPNPNQDINVNIEDTGEIDIAGDHLTTFEFIVNNHGLYYFSNENNFGTGLPISVASGLAVSGLIQLACSGLYPVINTYYPASYNGSNSSTSPIYQYGTSGSLISWKVPKYLSEDSKTYAGYGFSAYYINSSGILSGPVNFNYNASSLSQLYGPVPLSAINKTLTLNNNLLGPDPILVQGNTGRSRLAIGVNDINLAVVKYNQKGTYVSDAFTNAKPIYALSISVNENAQILGQYRISDIVQYYIQFDITNNGDWYRISPKPRVNELTPSGTSVPGIFILDTNLFPSDMISDVYQQVQFINIGREQYSFRVKIEMDTTITGSNGQWTPQIFDYRVSVIDRDAMLASSFEKYIFN